MKIDDFKSFTRPVVFETEYEETQYAISGSCFGVLYNNKCFILTAKHVIAEYDYNLVRVPVADGIKEFLDIRFVSEITYPQNDDDTYKFDLLLFEVNVSSLNQDLIDNTFFKIEKCILKPSNFSKCIIFGFPKTLNTVDYERKVLQLQRFQLLSTNIDNSPYEFCYKVDVGDDSKEKLNGMSGSFILGLIEDKGSYKYSFIGMLILENYFIEANWILELLTKHEEINEG